MLFKDITGQDTVKEKLIRTVKNQRISHAQLFLGPPSSKKLQMAVAYAQYINCKARTDEDSCGVCPSCIKFAKLIHPDLHFIYPVATTKEVKSKPTSKLFLEQWRELMIRKEMDINLPDWYNEMGIENKQGIINAEDCNDIIKTLGYKSYEAEYKVMIIWMVEKLYHAAAPKILKILEEPPEKTLFILVSEEQEQIIKTIRSRTQLVKFPKVKAPSPAMDESQPYFKMMVKWMRLCYADKLIEINDFVNTVSKIGREKQKEFLEFGLFLTRNSLMINYQNQELTELNEEQAAFLAKFHPFLNTANGYQFNELFNEGIYHIERNANPSILFMDISLKIIRLLKVSVSLQSN